MIIDIYKDHLHFGIFIDGDSKRVERKLEEFKAEGGGSEVEFGLFLIGDAKFVGDQFRLWENS